MATTTTTTTRWGGRWVRRATRTRGVGRTASNGWGRRVGRSRALVDAGAVETTAGGRLETFLRKPGRHAAFEATKTATRRVRERDDGRAVREYMALPASEYSTLDGESVERVSEDTFRVELSELSFLGFTLRPTLTARVRVREDGSGCEVRVEEMELSGSGIVESASEAFEIVSVNNVTWSDVPKEALNAEELEVLEASGGEFKDFHSETRVSVYLIIPGWFPFTIKSTERTGRFVVSQVVGQVVPRFLDQLAEDYRMWSSGDDSRTATGGGMFECKVDGECEVA